MKARSFILLGVVALGVFALSSSASASTPADYDWGLTPPHLIPEFRRAEKAAGLPGLGPFLAVKAWQAARAGQPILTRPQAAAWALAHPELGRDYINSDATEIEKSFRAMERVTLPLGVAGPYGGVGVSEKPWPPPAFYKAWGEIGSAGFFDLLAGANVYAGIHDGKFLPLLGFPASALTRLDIQLYCATYYVYRCLRARPLFARADGDPVKLWAGLGQCWDSPVGYAENSNPGAYTAFIARADEIGIDLASLPCPTSLANWPGASAVFTALGI